MKYPGEGLSSSHKKWISGGSLPCSNVHNQQLPQRHVPKCCSRHFSSPLSSPHLIFLSFFFLHCRHHLVKLSPSFSWNVSPLQPYCPNLLLQLVRFAPSFLWLIFCTDVIKRTSLFLSFLIKPNWPILLPLYISFAQRYISPFIIYWIVPYTCVFNTSLKKPNSVLTKKSRRD